MWNIGLNIPGGVPSGTAASLEEAKSAFKKSWLKFKTEIGPERLASALDLAEAARERLKRNRR